MAKFLFLMLGLPAQPDAGDNQTQAHNRKWRWGGTTIVRPCLELRR